MARYTGPVCRFCRREGLKLYLKGARCESPKCPIVQTRPPRNFPPGQHGQRRTRRPSEFGLQLREKQKVRRYYGLLETQFHKHYTEAVRRGGVTGDNLLQILESRLDNVVYRMGFADSRSQARQLVRHGHFRVNGRKTNIPSFMVKANDAVDVRPESRRREYFKDFGDILGTKTSPDWLLVDNNNLSGRVLQLPLREQISVPPFNDALIVEHYSR
ncbi:MAG: SSU ribosomal protein S4p (S9e) @ SSU ribosomal protein S4p (S9e), zinc-dependent [uncultured Thermomicrobiales bacterium]|uniref:Small ribosomal subunit protein uS4 n=1 Tax=uncultured Thermomicrobiales bacterium TaxID=1645740 RepID=A0A6J4U4V9_9BACT|nr:MAG: SSU ribosomal protein S4p (S9e) @ SSU ribosomal protein S4p (S9e), zinc-dependent [uncultured Thermomicrobiales bacterium]